jgi:RHH-type proline utilization regulon transcriptional repressor/proline dehydrogenase/delta 1-pyrroline-5-carboxylate dehydrogenase
LPERQNSVGYDLADFETLSQINQRRDHFTGCDWSATPIFTGRAKPIKTTPRCNPAVPEQRIGQLTPASASGICTAFNTAAPWQTTAINRANALNTAADFFEQHDGDLFALLACEAGKPLADAVSKLR